MKLLLYIRIISKRAPAKQPKKEGQTWGKQRASLVGVDTLTISDLMTVRKRRYRGPSDGYKPGRERPGSPPMSSAPLKTRTHRGINPENDG
jgi:hypothetical protein